MPMSTDEHETRLSTVTSRKAPFRTPHTNEVNTNTLTGRPMVPARFPSEACLPTPTPTPTPPPPTPSPFFGIEGLGGGAGAADVSSGSPVVGVGVCVPSRHFQQFFVGFELGLGLGLSLGRSGVVAWHRRERSAFADRLHTFHGRPQAKQPPDNRRCARPFATAPA